MSWVLPAPREDRGLPSYGVSVVSLNLLDMRLTARLAAPTACNFATLCEFPWKGYLRLSVVALWKSLLIAVNANKGRGGAISQCSLGSGGHSALAGWIETEIGLSIRDLPYMVMAEALTMTFSRYHGDLIGLRYVFRQCLNSRKTMF